MKTTFSRNELNTLNTKFAQLNSVEGEKLAYALSKNHSKVKAEVAAITAKQRSLQSDAHPKEREYYTKWQEIYKANAKKDEKGNPVITEDQKGWVLEDTDKFETEMKALDVEYKEVKEHIDGKNKKMQDFMAETIEIKFHEITDKWLETEGHYKASKEQMDIMRELFINEEA